MKVLIVDDRPENQLLLQEQLRCLQAESVMADSGARALRELRAQRFDLVVTDLLMPEMDGFQLCYLLKTDPELKRTPVIIYTANYATKKDEAQARDLGADDFLTRPMDEETLANRILNVMNQARTGNIAAPRAKPDEGFFREYSSLLIEKLEDQLIGAEENARLHVANDCLQAELAKKNADLTAINLELVRTNEDLEAYTYSVSHDLRTPVRAVRGLVQAVLGELGPSITPEVRRLFDRIEFNTVRMNALIEGLLEHYKMRNAGVSMERVELESVVASTISHLDFAIRLAQGSVRVASPLPAVIAHEPALVQIVTNLIENALKFVRPGVPPSVVIDAEVKGERVRLHVRDNGIGIPPAQHAKVFEIFERLHAESEYPGTGLGLAIVRRGVERMGGTIGIESGHVEGCTFWLELKAAPEPAPPPQFQS